MNLFRKIRNLANINKKTSVNKSESVDMARYLANSETFLNSRALDFISESDQETTEQLFEKLTENELYNMDPYQLADRMIKSDPLLDKALDDFVTYATSDFEYSCEDPNGDEILHDLFLLLEQKRNSFSQLLVQMFTSIFLRGSVCVEIVFNENSEPSNLFVIDPKYLRFRTQEDPVDGEVRVLGQFQNGVFVPVDSPTVIYEAINPLVDSSYGRSMIASSFPSLISSSLMHQDLRKIVKNHAWPQRFVAINTLALSQAGVDWNTIEDIVAKDINLIKNEWSKLPPEVSPIGTGEIELRQYPGANGSLNFVDILDRMYDRKSIRAVKGPPSMFGSNEFVAESSAEEQAIQYSIRISSFQSTVQRILQRVFTLIIRSQGIAGKVTFSLKRVNAKERERESRIFGVIMDGIKTAKDAGISVPMAVKIYQDVTGLRFSEELIAEIVADSDNVNDTESDIDDAESDTDSDM